MFKKLLSSLGIGSAKVNTIVQNPEIRVGEILHGEIHVLPGDVEQTIDQINLHLETNYISKVNESDIKLSFKLVSQKASDLLKIKPGERYNIPFQMQIPYKTPTTFGNQMVYLRTDVEIDMSVDATDHDYLTILPDPLAEEILNELEDLGFHHIVESGICRYEKQEVNIDPFVQTFLMKPSRGKYHQNVKQVELTFKPDQNGINVKLLIYPTHYSTESGENEFRFYADRQQGLQSISIEQMIQKALS